GTFEGRLEQRAGDDRAVTRCHAPAALGVELQVHPVPLASGLVEGPPVARAVDLEEERRLPVRADPAVTDRSRLEPRLGNLSRLRLDPEQRPAHLDREELAQSLVEVRENAVVAAVAGYAVRE